VSVVDGATDWVVDGATDWVVDGATDWVVKATEFVVSIVFTWGCWSRTVPVELSRHVADWEA
jgi:hypothetical protein